jgi:hypothetical protein
LSTQSTSGPPLGQSPPGTNRSAVTSVPTRPSTIAWLRSQADAWRRDALAKMKRAQEVRGEAGWLRDGPLKDAELAEADRLEREAEGLYGSSERWGA